jgi:CheY-like chemotaxis protein
MACILVVDDDALAAAMLSRDLLGLGHRPVIANTAAMAILAITDGEPIDLVITDIFMPEMDGIELIQLIRASNLTVPILAVSNGRQHLGSVLFNTALLLGANAALQKPFSASALAGSIDQLLGQGQAASPPPILTNPQ